MKKRISLILVVMLLLVSLVACGPQSDVDAESITLVFANGENSETMEIKLSDLGIELKTTTMMDEVLKAMKEKKGLVYKTNEFAPGMVFIEEIHTLSPDSSKNEFISIYSSIDDEEIRYIDGDERVANGVTVYATGVGIAELPIRDGVTYLFIMLTY